MLLGNGADRRGRGGPPECDRWIRCGISDTWEPRFRDLVRSLDVWATSDASPIFSP